MRRFAVVVGVVALAACGAPDEGSEGLYGSSGPAERSAQGTAGGDDGGPQADGDGDGDGDGDALPHDPTDGDPTGQTDSDVTPGADADCPPYEPPPPLTCPIVDCPAWEPWCDGDAIVVTGKHFAHPGQAALVVRFRGDYTADGCAPEAVDVRYRATYESAEQASFVFEAGVAPRGFGEGGGVFNGTMIVVNVETDGTEWTSAPVSVAIRF